MAKDTTSPATPPEPARSPETDPPDGEPATPARRRPPPSRLSPEALAKARKDGGAEGLAWLGREPEARASLLYRFLRLVARFVIFGLFRFHIDATGRELLPRSGGYLLIGAAHRGWMDPFVVMHALPEQPRCWFLAARRRRSPPAGASG